MNSSTVLIVDDNPEIREIIQILLTGEGFLARQAGDGAAALKVLKNNDIDLIILDIMMSDLNGCQTCLEIRRISDAPILFLHARTKDSDKTLVFSSGRDDCLSKPFSYDELISRCKALVRRYHVYQGKGGLADRVKQPKTLYYHHLAIQETDRQVFTDGKLLELTDTEYALLLLLVKNQKQIFSAEKLFETVWEKPYYYGANNTVMVHIRNLRCKIEKDPASPQLIKTIWGRGYCCE